MPFLRVEEMALVEILLNIVTGNNYYISIYHIIIPGESHLLSKPFVKISPKMPKHGIKTTGKDHRICQDCHGKELSKEVAVSQVSQWLTYIPHSNTGCTLSHCSIFVPSFSHAGCQHVTVLEVCLSERAPPWHLTQLNGCKTLFFLNQPSSNNRFTWGLFWNFRQTPKMATVSKSLIKLFEFPASIMRVCLTSLAVPSYYPLSMWYFILTEMTDFYKETKECSLFVLKSCYPLS